MNTEFTVVRLPEFDVWLDSIKDKTTRIRLQKRLDKLKRGIFGDNKRLSETIWELREHFGAGYRLYYTRRGNMLIIMLGGGDKSTQDKDIATAIALESKIEG